jgi:hypothetical protein
LLDPENKTVQLYSSPQHEETVLPAVAARITSDVNHRLVEKQLKLKVKAKALVDQKNLPVDRLTMLELIGRQVAANEAKQFYRITNGDELFDYQVTLGQRQKVKVAGQKLQARKVKIEAFELTAEGEQVMENQDEISQLRAAEAEQPKYAHAPIYAWFSEIEGTQVAVKFLNRHAIGDFVVEMVSSQ